MDQQEQQTKLRAFYSWKVGDKVSHDRGTLWYIIMTALGIAIFVYSIFTANFLFAIMVILVVFIVIVKDYVPAKEITFAITDKGIFLGGAFTDYRDLESFYVVYDPPEVKKLYFEFKGWKPDLSVDLLENDPIVLRDFLLKVLPENLEKEEEHPVDVFERILKL